MIFPLPHLSVENGPGLGGGAGHDRGHELGPVLDDHVDVEPRDGRLVHAGGDDALGQDAQLVRVGAGVLLLRLDAGDVRGEVRADGLGHLDKIVMIFLNKK